MIREWTQGNWNAFMVIDCQTREQSRDLFAQVPEPFRKGAGAHAGTWWDIQDAHTPIKPVKRQIWPLVEITPAHWAAGKAHLEGSNWAQMQKFGNQVLGFAAEHTVADWFKGEDVEHNHNPDPRGTGPDYTINGLTVDLKSVGTVGIPRPDYEAPLAERQRLKDSGQIDWYLFGKYDNTTSGDYYIIGFQTEAFILANGVFYRAGEVTAKKMKAPVDCWVVGYKQLIKPMDWINGKR